MRSQNPLLGSEVTPIVTHDSNLTMDMLFVGRAFLGMSKTEKSLLKNTFFHVVHKLFVPPWLAISSISTHLSCKEWMSWGSQGRESFSTFFRWAIYWDPHDNEDIHILIWIILLEFFLLLILLLFYYSWNNLMFFYL